jgi:ABC-type Mn2+/Zn2+ transport system permease subunit
MHANFPLCKLAPLQDTRTAASKYLLAAVLALIVLAVSFSAPSHAQAPLDLPSAEIDDPPLAKQNRSGSPSVTKTPAAPAESPKPATPGEDETALDEAPDTVSGAAPPGVSWWRVDAVFSGPANAFMRRALAAGLLAAVGCGFIGVFVVLRRSVFVGVALAEVSSAGVALALVLGFAPLLGSALAMALGVLAFSVRLAPRRVPVESATGVAYAAAGAVAILLIASAPGGEGHMLKLLQGDVLTVEAGETWQMAAAFALVAAVHGIFGRQLMFVLFDRETAGALGFRSATWELVLLATVGIVVAFAVRAVGVLMTSALLVVPAVAALLLARRLRHALWLSPVLASASALVGLQLSFVLDVPASAATVVVAVATLILAAIKHAVSRA